MLTDTEARALLHQAADTIEVGPSAQFAPPPRPPTRFLAPVLAVAAVLLLAVGVAVWHTRKPGPVDRPPGKVTVPSVYGLPTDAALSLLRTHHLEPRVRTTFTCDDGRALRTEPVAGTRVAPRTTTTLVAGVNGDFVCPATSRSYVWGLVDLAVGAGPLPRFDDHVLLSVNDEPSVRLSPAAAADPERWPTCGADEPTCSGSALDVVRNALELPAARDGRTFVPRLEVSPTSGDGSSFTFRFAAAPVGSVTSKDSDSVREPPWSVSMQVNSSGAINAVRLDFHTKHGAEPPTPDAPDQAVVGRDPTGIGRRFVDFALGRIDGFPADTPVAIYLGNVYRRTMTESLAFDPQAWSTCVRYAAQSCPPSALATIASYEQSTGEPVRLGGPDTTASRCLARSGPPPRDTGGTRPIVVTPSGRTTCLNGFRIELWINDVGQVVAVNELLAEP